MRHGIIRNLLGTLQEPSIETVRKKALQSGYRAGFPTEGAGRKEARLRATRDDDDK